MILENGKYHPTYTVKIRKKFAREFRIFTVLATPDKSQADIEYVYNRSHRKIGYVIEGQTFLHRNISVFSCSRDEMTLTEAHELKMGETWVGQDTYCHIFREQEAAELVASTMSHLKRAGLGEVTKWTGKEGWALSITHLTPEYKPLSEKWLQDSIPFRECPLCGQLPKLWIFDNGAFAKCECKAIQAVHGETIMEFHKAHKGDMRNWHNHSDLRDAWNKAQKLKALSKFGI